MGVFVTVFVVRARRSLTSLDVDRQRRSHGQDDNTGGAARGAGPVCNIRRSAAIIPQGEGPRIGGVGRTCADADPEPLSIIISSYQLEMHATRTEPWL